MQPARQYEVNTAALSRRQGSSAWVGWLLVCFGLAISIISGSLVTRAWPERHTFDLAAGIMMSLCGVLAVIAGIIRAVKSIKALHESVTIDTRPNGEQVLPRLGEILIYKYNLITEKDIQKALARQRETAGKPLGEILVEMGRISWRDLTKALEDQLAYGDPWKRK